VYTTPAKKVGIFKFLLAGNEVK